MKIANEIQTQQTIQDWLGKNDLFPFSLVFSMVNDTGLCSITFYTSIDLNDFLDLLDYNTLCDRSGYLIYEKTNTVILKDIALVKLYSILL